MMWRNIPNNYTQDDILLHIQEECFEMVVDFLYAPRDMLNNALSGYVFLNFVASCHAEEFKEKFHRPRGGVAWKRVCDGEVKTVVSNKVSEVHWSNNQGLEAHIERYRNSPIMHSVPAEHLPWLFKDGVRIPFPQPTKTLTKTMQFKTQPRSKWLRNTIDRVGELPMDQFMYDSSTAAELQRPAMPDSLPRMPATMWQEGVMPAPAGSQPVVYVPVAWELPATTTDSSLRTAAPQEGVTPAPTGSQQASPVAPSLQNFCHSCGNKFPEVAKFCPGCGVPRRPVNATQQSQPDSFTPETRMHDMQYIVPQVHGLDPLSQMSHSPESATPISCH